jgi:hypothetical protein
MTLGVWQVSWAYTQPCELVAQLSGPDYEVKPKRMAMMQSPSFWPEGQSPTLLGRNGVWFIYQGRSPWFAVDACAPQRMSVNGQSVMRVPVVLNLRTGVNAVVTSRFVIKVRRQRDLEQLSARYGFNLITRLPNRFTAVFDVGTPASYDSLLETLDRDRDIEYALPIVSEP